MSCKLLDYPARGLYGFRVCRCIGGQVYDEFYSLIDRQRRVAPGRTRHERMTGDAFLKVRRMALRRDSELGGMQRVYRAYVAARAQPQTRAARMTTVRGIRFCSNRPGRLGHLPPAPGFLVSVKVGRQRVTRYFTLPDPFQAPEWQDAWVSAVNFLARTKDLRDWASLLERTPDMRSALTFQGARELESRLA